MSDVSILSSPEFFSGVVQVITALTALLAAVSSFVALLQGRSNGRKIEAVHVATNSRMDQLVSEVRESSEAKGFKKANDEAAAKTNGG